MAKKAVKKVVAKPTKKVAKKTAKKQSTDCQRIDYQVVVTNNKSGVTATFNCFNQG